MVYAKRPFGGPKAVLAYLSRYTHRVAISNRRLVAADDGGCRSAGRTIASKVWAAGKTMTPPLRTSSSGASGRTCCPRLHRIRHDGLLASGTRAVNIARARQLLAVPTCSEPPDTP